MKKLQTIPTHLSDDCILVLQGGGALGAYQAGVFEALGKAYREPNWVAGISIGAINAALIAGNPVQRRIERLHEFWDLVSSLHPWPAFATVANARETLNDASASQVMLFGVPGFFAPRFPPAPFQPRGSPAAISYYDTSALEQTLERLVDFELINSGKVRLSVVGYHSYYDLEAIVLTLLDEPTAEKATGEKPAEKTE